MKIFSDCFCCVLFEKQRIVYVYGTNGGFVDLTDHMYFEYLICCMELF